MLSSPTRTDHPPSPPSSSDGDSTIQAPPSLVSSDSEEIQIHCELGYSNRDDEGAAKLCRRAVSDWQRLHSEHGRQCGPRPNCCITPSCWKNQDRFDQNHIQEQVDSFVDTFDTLNDGNRDGRRYREREPDATVETTWPKCRCRRQSVSGIQRPSCQIYAEKTSGLECLEYGQPEAPYGEVGPAERAQKTESPLVLDGTQETPPSQKPTQAEVQSGKQADQGGSKAASSLSVADRILGFERRGTHSELPKPVKRHRKSKAVYDEDAREDSPDKEKEPLPMVFPLHVRKFQRRDSKAAAMIQKPDTPLHRSEWDEDLAIHHPAPQRSIPALREPPDTPSPMEAAVGVARTALQQANEQASRAKSALEQASKQADRSGAAKPRSGPFNSQAAQLKRSTSNKVADRQRELEALAAKNVSEGPVLRRSTLTRGKDSQAAIPTSRINPFAHFHGTRGYCVRHGRKAGQGSPGARSTRDMFERSRSDDTQSSADACPDCVAELNIKKKELIDRGDFGRESLSGTEFRGNGDEKPQEEFALRAAQTAPTAMVQAQQNSLAPPRDEALKASSSSNQAYSAPTVQRNVERRKSVGQAWLGTESRDNGVKPQQGELALRAAQTEPSDSTQARQQSHAQPKNDALKAPSSADQQRPDSMIDRTHEASKTVGHDSAHLVDREWVLGAGQKRPPSSTGQSNQEPTAQLKDEAQKGSSSGNQAQADSTVHRNGEPSKTVGYDAKLSVGHGISELKNGGNIPIEGGPASVNLQGSYDARHDPTQAAAQGKSDVGDHGKMAIEDRRAPAKLQDQHHAQYDPSQGANYGRAIISDSRKMPNEGGVTRDNPQSPLDARRDPTRVVDYGKADTGNSTKMPIEGDLAHSNPQNPPDAQHDPTKAIDQGKPETGSSRKLPDEGGLANDNPQNPTDARRNATQVADHGQSSTRNNGKTPIDGDLARTKLQHPNDTRQDPAHVVEHGQSNTSNGERRPVEEGPAHATLQQPPDAQSSLHDPSPSRQFSWDSVEVEPPMSTRRTSPGHPSPSRSAGSPSSVYAASENEVAPTSDRQPRAVHFRALSGSKEHDQHNDDDIVVQRDLGDGLDAMILERGGRLERVVMNSRKGGPTAEVMARLAKELSQVSSTISTTPTPRHGRGYTDGSVDEIIARRKTVPELEHLLTDAADAQEVKAHPHLHPQADGPAERVVSTDFSEAEELTCPGDDEIEEYLRRHPSQIERMMMRQSIENDYRALQEHLDSAAASVDEDYQHQPIGLGYRWSTPEQYRSLSFPGAKKQNPNLGSKTLPIMVEEERHMSEYDSPDTSTCTSPSTSGLPTLPSHILRAKDMTPTPPSPLLFTASTAPSLSPSVNNSAPPSPKTPPEILTASGTLKEASTKPRVPTPMPAPMTPPQPLGSPSQVKADSQVIRQVMRMEKNKAVQEAAAAERAARRQRVVRREVERALE